MKTQISPMARFNEALYDKMLAAQEKYRVWLLSQPAEEILSHTYEYTTRESILLALKYCDLKGEQTKALLKLPDPLEEIFCACGQMDTRCVCDIVHTIEHTAAKAYRAEKEGINDSGKI